MPTMAADMLTWSFERAAMSVPVFITGCTEYISDQKVGEKEKTD